MKEKQVFNNAKWIIVCKIAQSVLQLIIGMISARYLKPTNYGIINYAASIVAFALPIMKLGFDSVLVYELVKSPEREGEIMGTSLFFNLLSSLLCMGGVYLFAVLANMGQTKIILVCVLYSTSIFFAALEMAQYWFQYKLLSKYSSLIMLVAYLVVSAYKIFLLATHKSIYWFALSHSVEYAVVGVCLIIFFRKKSGAKLTVSLKCAKEMWKSSKHYMLGALMIVVIQNTDHIMLTLMSGEAENGYYSAAITSAGVAQFVFTAIIDSFRPLILESKKNNTNEYEKNMSRLYCVIVYLSIAQSVAFTIFAPFIIKVLYGEMYMASVRVLRILTWYRAFSFMGRVRNIWLLAEDKQKYLPIINLTGVITNIALNAFAIRLWGACGAAAASLITQIAMNFALGFVFAPLRENNHILISGLSPGFAFAEFKKLLKSLSLK